MRIKIDFVSNSSSAGFILHGKLSGMIDRPFCLQGVRKELEGEITTKYSGKSYEAFKYFFKSDGYEDDDGKSEVSLSHGTFYKDDKNGSLVEERPVTFVEAIIEGRSIDPQLKNSFVRKEIKRLLQAILSQEQRDKVNGNFSYLQYPEPFGDGLDGGDPMGFYAYSRDIHLKETLSGEIVIRGKEMFLKLKGEEEEKL